MRNGSSRCNQTPGTDWPSSFMLHFPELGNRCLLSPNNGLRKTPQHDVFFIRSAGFLEDVGAGSKEGMHLTYFESSVRRFFPNLKNRS